MINYDNLTLFVPLCQLNYPHRFIGFVDNVDKYNTISVYVIYGWCFGWVLGCEVNLWAYAGILLLLAQWSWRFGRRVKNLLFTTTCFLEFVL